MSPEQVECIPVDERTDIYSLGITAYEMVTGQRPFQEKDVFAAMDLNLHQDIPDPSILEPKISRRLKRFILKACTRDLNRRYRNMREIIEDLQPSDEQAGKSNSYLSMDQKTTTIVLQYKDEHQTILSSMLHDFCEKMKRLGVECASLDI